MSERSEDRELMALESALRELQPQSEKIDRAVLMYRAGRESLRGWIWPAVASGMALLSTVLGFFLLLRPAPAVIERIVHVPAPAIVPQPPVEKQLESISPPAPEPLVMETFDSSPQGRYLQMEENVLRWGLKGIPPPPPAPPLPETPTVEQLLQSL
jgi:hypothetical protein